VPRVERSVNGALFSVQIFQNLHFMYLEIFVGMRKSSFTPTIIYRVMYFFCKVYKGGASHGLFLTRSHVSFWVIPIYRYC
jgi:hypothetical protein